MDESFPILGQKMTAHHLFMKGQNWWGLFYRIEDCIMYFTTFSVFARRMEMVFIAFSIMFNHTHATTLDETRQRITLFQRQVGVSTAHTYNREYGREGQLWHHSFGFSVKHGIKRILGNIAYVFNNCVAGKMNRRAMDNRWTLLAYYNNSHPFSEPIIKEKCSRKMERAMKLVDISYDNDEPLNYATQRRLFSGLNKKEKAQIIDYLISRYNFLDYRALISLYGSFETAIIAIDSNAGGEYDLKDDTGDHSCYMKMIALTHQMFPNLRKLNVEMLSDEQKNQLATAFRAILMAKEENIRKFLHFSPGA